MISSSYRFIYLHAPKTGGNSIQTVLQPYSDDNFILRGHQDGHDRFEVEGNTTPRKHAYLSDYARALGNKVYDYSTIISVRQPLHRAISFYFSPHRWMRKYDGADGWKLESAFWSMDEFEKCLKSIVPMTDFIKIEGKPIRPDHVIRFETIAADFNRCAKTLGVISNPAKLPHVNRSAAAEMVENVMHNKEASYLVKERFAADYEFFGYS